MARPSSARERDGAGHHQEVEMHWPLFRAKKGAQEDKPPEDIKIRGITGAVEEGAGQRKI